MDKKLILGVAGAGKTYYLCSQIDASKKNLIIAFTNQNIKNIKNELIKAYGDIPKNTIVETYHKFLYNCFITPYFPSFKENYNENKGLKIKGLSFRDEPKQSIVEKGRYRRNSKYICDKELGHFFDEEKIYCSRMSKLCMKNKKVTKKVIENLKKFFDEIYIDEFQDFRNEDYKLLMYLAKIFENIIAVGDYYQHSVSGRNNTGIPFKKGKKTIALEEYISLVKKENWVLDQESLVKSRRCPKKICEFVKEKLGIEIEANNKNNGDVFLVTKNRINDVLNDDSIVKLVFKESDKYNFNSINWGLSKGDTYKSTCIILTGTFSKLGESTFETTESQESANKLYVALTRTKGDLYIVKKEIFDCVKNYYRK